MTTAGLRAFRVRFVGRDVSAWRDNDSRSPGYKRIIGEQRGAGKSIVGLEIS